MEDTPICFSVTIHPEDSRTNRLHRHRTHELVLVRSGAGTQRTPTRVYRAEPGRVFLFPAGEDHLAECRPGEEQDLIVLNLPASFFAPSTWERELSEAWEVLTAYCRNDSLIDMESDPASQNEARILFERMRDEFAAKRPGYHAAVRVFLSEVLLLLLRSQWWRDHIPHHGGSRSGSQLMQDACRYVEAHVFRPIPVSEMLEVCNLSRSHFHALFRRHTGRTFVQYVLGLRINRAEHILRSTDDPVAHVAESCGFASPAHFTAVFRARVGLTPTAFRNAGGS